MSLPASRCCSRSSSAGREADAELVMATRRGRGDLEPESWRRLIATSFSGACGLTPTRWTPSSPRTGAREVVGAPGGVARRATLEAEEDQDDRAGGQQLGEHHLPTVDLRQGERRDDVTDPHHRREPASSSSERRNASCDRSCSASHSASRSACSASRFSWTEAVGGAISAPGNASDISDSLLDLKATGHH